MPLVQVKTQPHLCPPQNGAEPKSKGRKITKRFGSALPQMFMDNLDELRLDFDTPIEGIQVDYECFNKSGESIPDMWVMIVFSEKKPSKSDCIKVVSHLEKLFDAWFKENGYDMPEKFAVDCFWGDSNGFLRFGDKCDRW